MFAGPHSGGSVDAQLSVAEAQHRPCACEGLPRGQAHDRKRDGALDGRSEGGAGGAHGLDQAIGGDDPAEAVGVAARLVWSGALDREAEGPRHGRLLGRAMQAQDGKGFVKTGAGRDHPLYRPSPWSMSG